jgi:benzoate/toluate 1,2-dioxygenase reductase subunit
LEEDMTELLQGDPSRRYEVKLVSRNWVSDKTLELKFDRPADFIFSPGQRIRISHEKGERDYSLISAQGDSYLALLVRVVEGGRLSPVLAAAKEGTPFSFTGPYGYFVWLPSERPAVFVATGTGVAPFISMAISGVRGFTLIHGVRQIDELYERSLLRAAAATYVPCLSNPSPGVEVDVFEGRVTSYLRSRLDRGVYDFYVCGSEDMIREVTVTVDEQFEGSSVYAEPFY